MCHVFSLRVVQYTLLHYARWNVHGLSTTLHLCRKELNNDYTEQN